MLAGGLLPTQVGAQGTASLLCLSLLVLEALATAWSEGVTSLLSYPRTLFAFLDWPFQFSKAGPRTLGVLGASAF